METLTQPQIKENYIAPVSGYSKGDAEEHLENLHEMFVRTMKVAAIEGDFTPEWVDSINYTYAELRDYLKKVVKNANELDSKA